MPESLRWDTKMYLRHSDLKEQQKDSEDWRGRG